jgi:hypothetical protein
MKKYAIIYVFYRSVVQFGLRNTGVDTAGLTAMQSSWSPTAVKLGAHKIE